MSRQVYIHFHGTLNDFLKPDRRDAGFDFKLTESRSVKDLAESLGVPHTEIDLIIINGKSVDFDYRVQAGEKIELYPTLKSSHKHGQPAALAVPRFVLDVHLGRLAAYLRMLGFDTLYKNDCDDPTLADISADEHRILLTCDRLLLMRKQISHGYFVRNRQPQQQLLEILSRFNLYDNLKPFTRCMHCNGKTRPVEKQLIETHLLPKTKKYYHDFFQCDSCKKIYWKGSHYQRMQEMINSVKTGTEF